MGLSFFEGFPKTASKSIEKSMKGLNNLIQCLALVRKLMKQLAVRQSIVVTDNILANLQNCNKDVYRWLDQAEELIPSSSTGGKAILRKFLLALEKQKLKDIYSEISVYEENADANFTLLKRFFDIDQSATLKSLWNKFDDLDGRFEAMLVIPPSP